MQLLVLKQKIVNRYKKTSNTELNSILKSSFFPNKKRTIRQID